MGFHPAKFGLPRPFRYRVMLRHGTDRQTPRPILECLLPYGGGGIIIRDVARFLAATLQQLGFLFHHIPVFDRPDTCFMADDCQLAADARPLDRVQYVFCTL